MELKLKPLLSDSLLCPVESVYLHRKEQSVAIKAPHTIVGEFTIARWLKTAIEFAGMDTIAYAAQLGAR